MRLRVGFLFFHSYHSISQFSPLLFCFKPVPLIYKKYVQLIICDCLVGSIGGKLAHSMEKNKPDPYLTL